MIKCSLCNCHKAVKETAFTALVRPKLEDKIIAWDPYLNRDSH